MSIIQALILGVVQGLTEFLPVSSSGHLVLVQKIFGISQDALLFDTMVHVGTLVAVVVVLWKDIWAILRHLIQPLTGYLILATIPAVIVALPFEHAIEDAFSSGSFLGFAFLITAFFLLVSELIYRQGIRKTAGLPNSREGRPASSMTWVDALIIGIMQAVAILPGVSRSGSTLSGAISRRLDRDFAARFSFLLSIPAILGALVLQLKDLASGEVVVTGSAIGVAPIAVGTISAAVVGFFSVRLMLKIVREKSLLGFSLYTAILGVLVLIDRFGTHFFF
jgi:undecaprenyl-diphosphatase